MLIFNPYSHLIGCKNENLHYKVVWIAQAFERLQEIKEFITIYGSLFNANRLIERLIEHGGSLSTFYKRGRLVSEIDKEDIRELIEGNSRIVYRVKASEIEILTVFEAHRLLKDEELVLSREQGAEGN